MITKIKTMPKTMRYLPLHDYNFKVKANHASYSFLNVNDMNEMVSNLKLVKNYSLTLKDKINVEASKVIKNSQNH